VRFIVCNGCPSECRLPTSGLLEFDFVARKIQNLVQVMDNKKFQVRARTRTLTHMHHLMLPVPHGPSSPCTCVPCPLIGGAAAARVVCFVALPAGGCVPAGLAHNVGCGEADPRGDYCPLHLPLLPPGKPAKCCCCCCCCCCCGAVTKCCCCHKGAGSAGGFTNRKDVACVPIPSSAVPSGGLCCGICNTCVPFPSTWHCCCLHTTAPLFVHATVAGHAPCMPHYCPPWPCISPTLFQHAPAAHSPSLHATAVVPVLVQA